MSAGVALALSAADRSRLLALLIKQLRDFTLAEDALQDAFVSAVTHWGTRGPPENPSAWLLQVARRRAIDRLRRDVRRKNSRVEADRISELDHWEDGPPMASAIPDERLSLIFTCCHPALDRNASVALTLRTLCGLTTEEIARAFLTSKETMAQRLVRVKAKIAAARIPYVVPGHDEIAHRIDAVLAVIYLIFNEGYAASGTRYLRIELCDEAIRLALLVASHLPDETEAQGLAALLEFHRARFVTRTGDDGVPLSLEEQDRTRWDHDAISAIALRLESTLKLGKPGPYQIQAAIAALHCEAKSFAATDWPQIAALYGRLSRLTGNKAHELNQIVAISYLRGVRGVLPLIDTLAPWLNDYQPYHAARADLYARAGHTDIARRAYAQAMTLTQSEAEKAFLERRLHRLAEPNINQPFSLAVNSF